MSNHHFILTQEIDMKSISPLLRNNLFPSSNTCLSISLSHRSLSWQRNLQPKLISKSPQYYRLQYAGCRHVGKWLRSWSHQEKISFRVAPNPAIQMWICRKALFIVLVQNFYCRPTDCRSHLTPSTSYFVTCSVVIEKSCSSVSNLWPILLFLFYSEQPTSNIKHWRAVYLKVSTSYQKFMYKLPLKRCRWRLLKWLRIS